MIFFVKNKINIIFFLFIEFQIILLFDHLEEARKVITKYNYNRDFDNNNISSGTNLRTIVTLSIFDLD
jgi:hypothetical protein